MTTPPPMFDVEAMDLERHAVLEASAGAGKTHAIGRIVLRLLRERRARIDRILLVTFTEKAAGELKDRIRRDIEGEIDQAPGASDALREALDQYDQAAIHTIHGFCHWLLQNRADDLGQDFRFERVDDADHVRETLRDVQKKDWHRVYGDQLATLLRAAEFQREKAAEWERAIREIALRYRPESGHRLVPDPDAPGDAAAEPYRLAAQTVVRVQQMLADDKRQRGLLSFDDMIRRVDEGLDPAKNPRAADIAASLREQFRYAIVDEFQDTDPIQWRIFRRLFVDAGKSRLVLVGDPKQAIYGFRGADLPTYLEATRHLREERGAAEHPLALNWRSDPALIESLNGVFGGDYFPEPSGIRYIPAGAPPADKRRTEIVRDETGDGALTAFDVTDVERPAEARRVYAERVADTIARLLDGPRLAYRLRGAERPLSASDVCLLVFRRSEADDYVAALAQRRIPFTFYKRGRMREGPEARDLRLVLKALAHPEEESLFRRALLTRFFRVPPIDLIAAGSLPASHPARRLFRDWLGHCEARRWAALFTSLLEDTGILFHERAAPDYDRRVANLRMLAGSLQQAAYRDNLDLFELHELAEQPPPDDPDADNPPQETEAPRVRIMTVHASKGLEFPVVFLAGGFTDPQERGVRSYRDDAGRLVFDLPLTLSGAKKPLPGREKRMALIRAQRVDEERRLLYVALTRAMFKLYVPHTMQFSRGHAPVPSLLVPALARSAAAQPPGQAPERTATPASAAVEPEALIVVASLVAPLDPTLHERRASIQSFSRLHRRKEAENAFGDRDDLLDESDDVAPAPDDPFHGVAFGELVHAVLERFEFAEARGASAPERLEETSLRLVLDEEIPRFLPRFAARLIPEDQFAAACRKRVRDAVWAALVTPLSALGARLCDVPATDRLQELEFLVPAADLKAEFGERSREEWLCTGFMDLVFRRGEKVYLLDWKTNLLPGYGPDEIARAMEESDYRLQYRLYWNALERWLRAVHGDAFSPARHVGGVFYLFVRGMNGRDDAAGVHFAGSADLFGGRS